MKIKLFIVTYNNPNILNQNLQSLFSSDYIDSDKHEIFIINNHTNFYIDNCFSNRVKILNNTCRPDFSTGHLARSWNQALINGFKNLNNPDADIVLHVQDDTIYEKDFTNKLINLHSRYSFISDGVGDNLCSYTADGVKNIGIWDERFCNIGYQEADYFIRAIIYNNQNSSINDYHHNRVFNPIGYPLVDRIVVHNNMHSDRAKSLQYHSISKQFFIHKWGNINTDLSVASYINKPNIPTYVTYPYFEKDIYDLPQKGYFANFNEPSFPDLKKFIID